MAYSESLAERIREVLDGPLEEKKMFGGIAVLLDGNMCCGVVGETLMLRLGEVGAAAALKEKHTRPMDFTGKPLKTMVYVDPDGFRTTPQLRKWIQQARAFAVTLPPKAR